MGFPRIIFMGTPEFAVASLDALFQAGFEIAAVITAPDRPAGRGMKLTESAVKKYAVGHQLPVLQPEKLKDPGFLQQVQQLRADLQVVVAFRMLPEVLWSMPPMGTINVHASLLPKYRGAAPINWAVINGEKETGVTTFKLAHQIDTGNILLQESVPIPPDATAGELHDVLKKTGALLLVQTVNGLADGSVREKPQATLIDDPLLLERTHAPKIFTDTCRIHWTEPVMKINNLVRGLSPFPGAFTELQGKIFKIFRAEPVQASHKLAPGTFETDHKTYLRFAAADGLLYAREIQAEGKKRMDISEFLRGFR